MSPKNALPLLIRSNDHTTFKTFESVIIKLGNLQSMTFSDEKVDGALGFVIKGDEFFIPVEMEIDVEKEKAEINAELQRTKGFLKGVMGKLSNERFVSGAPEQVVAMEKKKQADAEAKIKVLEEKLNGLS